MGLDLDFLLETIKNGATRISIVLPKPLFTEIFREAEKRLTNVHTEIDTADLKYPTSYGKSIYATFVNINGFPACVVVTFSAMPEKFTIEARLEKLEGCPPQFLAKIVRKCIEGGKL